jgi:hypothetical protein
MTSSPRIAVPKIVAYLAHPIGPGKTMVELANRRDNIANALAWLRWLVDHSTWSISAPWLPYVQVLDEGTYGDRGIADDLAGLERCDLIILTGGRTSAGMAAERDHAKELGMPVVDLTSWGFSPPSTEDNAAAALDLRAKQALARTPRRPWLPPLDADAIGELRGNRAVLRGHGVDFRTLDAIIAAAEARS